MNAQEKMMRGLAAALSDWAEHLRSALPTQPGSVDLSHLRVARAAGRLEGLSAGLTAIADLAADDAPVPEAAE